MHVTKHHCLVIIFVCLVFLCSCSPLRISGLEEYRPQTCSVGLTQNLYPCDDFFDLYDYEAGDYFFIEDADLLWGHVTAFSYLRYSADTYEEAKNYCLTEWTLCTEHQYTYEGYQFAEHIPQREESVYDPNHVECDYPDSFNMFGYNDETYTLIFLGYYNGDPRDTTKAQAETDFSNFIDTTFSQYYNFHD